MMVTVQRMLTAINRTQMPKIGGAVRRRGLDGFMRIFRQPKPSLLCTLTVFIRLIHVICRVDAAGRMLLGQRSATPNSISLWAE